MSEGGWTNGGREFPWPEHRRIVKRYSLPRSLWGALARALAGEVDGKLARVETPSYVHFTDNHAWVRFGKV